MRKIKLTGHATAGRGKGKIDKGMKIRYVGSVQQNEGNAEYEGNGGEWNWRDKRFQIKIEIGNRGCDGG